MATCHPRIPEVPDGLAHALRSDPTVPTPPTFGNGTHHNVRYRIKGQTNGARFAITEWGGELSWLRVPRAAALAVGMHATQKERGFEMLETIAVILLLLWVLGLVSSYTIGGFIHVLLVLAIVVVLVRVIQGRRPI